MELKIDPKELMAAAIAKVFAESNPEALAEAMAVTVLQKTGYGNKTVLEDIVESAVRQLTREVIEEVIQLNREAIVRRIEDECSHKIINDAVDSVQRKMGWG